MSKPDYWLFALRHFTPAALRAALQKMYLIRRFEEGAEDCYSRGLLHGTMHLSIGHEASAMATCMDLSDADKITSTHRGHGHCIAKGADVGRMFAEFFGKETGYCHGRGGSMHIADVKLEIWARMALSAAVCRLRWGRRCLPKGWVSQM